MTENKPFTIDTSLPVVRYYGNRKVAFEYEGTDFAVDECSSFQKVKFKVTDGFEFLDFYYSRNYYSNSYSSGRKEFKVAKICQCDESHKTCCVVLNSVNKTVEVYRAALYRENDDGVLRYLFTRFFKAKVKKKDKKVDLTLSLETYSWIIQQLSEKIMSLHDDPIGYCADDSILASIQDLKNIAKEVNADYDALTEDLLKVRDITKYQALRIRGMIAKELAAK